jgi:response regulator receiver domain-containing protein
MRRPPGAQRGLWSTAGHNAIPSGLCDDWHMGTSVLIVDDHEAFRRFARALLQAEGFDVVGEAEDAASAVETAARLRPQLVLLDIQLPDEDGFAVAGRGGVVGDDRIGLSQKRVHRLGGAARHELRKRVDELRPLHVHLGRKAPREDSLDDDVRNGRQRGRERAPLLEDDLQLVVAGVPAAVQGERAHAARMADG